MKLLVLLGVAAGARTWRSEGARAPGQTGNLLREISRLLTCSALEDYCLDQCSVTPVYKAVVQFTGSQEGCQTTYRSSPEFRAVLEQFAGPGANCDTLLEKWMFHLTPSGKQKFSDGPECVEHVRTYDFATHCLIPGGAPTTAPSPPTTAPAAPAAAAPNGTAPANGTAATAGAPAAAAPAPGAEGSETLGAVSVTTPPLPVPNEEPAVAAAAAPAQPVEEAGAALLRKRRLVEMANMLWS